MKYQLNLIISTYVLYYNHILFYENVISMFFVIYNYYAIKFIRKYAFCTAFNNVCYYFSQVFFVSKELLQWIHIKNKV